MARRAYQSLRVQRLPLGLFGFRRADVAELAARMEAQELGAAESFRSVVQDQTERVARTLARRDALIDVLEGLRRDRGRLERQLAQARANASPLAEGTERQIARLSAEHAEERERLVAYLPEVDEAIASTEEEIRQLAAALQRVLHSPAEPAEISAEFADVAVALLRRPPEQLPAHRLPGGRTLFELPSGAARVQVRGGANLGGLTGVVVSRPPQRVLGFSVGDGAAAGVIPASDVVALRQGQVMVRDKYRLVQIGELPEESAWTIFPLGPVQPAGPQEIAAAGVAAAQPTAAAEAAAADAVEPVESVEAQERPEIGADALVPSVPEEILEPAARFDVDARPEAGAGFEGETEIETEAEEGAEAPEMPQMWQPEPEDEVEEAPDAAPAVEQAEPEAAMPDVPAEPETPSIVGREAGDVPPAKLEWPRTAAVAGIAAHAEPQWPQEVPRPAWQLATPREVAAASAQGPKAAAPAGSGRQGPSVANAASVDMLAFIVGKVVGRDLVTADGTVIARRGTTITPELAERVQEAGMLAEMIVYMALPGGRR